MTTQKYHGHTIDVTCFGAGDRFAYRTTVFVERTGELRYKETSLGTVYGSELLASDEAFSAALAWVERHPAGSFRPTA